MLPDGVEGPALARWYPDYVLVLEEPAAEAAVSAAAAGKARAAAAAPRFSWNEPLTVRAAEIRVVAVADGAQAGDVLADLAGTIPGRRVAVSGRRSARERAAQAGATAAGPDWLLGPLQQAVPRSPAGGSPYGVPSKDHRAEGPGHEH
jgi:hypothetical protein